MTKLKLAILGSGRGSNFSAIYQNIQKGTLEAQIVLVLSDKPSKMLAQAKDYGLVTIYLNPQNFSDRNSYDQELIKHIKSSGADLVILAGYMKILTPDFIKAFPNRILNIHPSLLPDFKGLHPQRQALQAGVVESGCTVHYVNEELDGGPIILQKKVPVLPGDTEESLAQRILQEEHKIYTQALKIVSKNLKKVE